MQNGSTRTLLFRPAKLQSLFQWPPHYLQNNWALTLVLIGERESVSSVAHHAQGFQQVLYRGTPIPARAPWRQPCAGGSRGPSATQAAAQPALHGTHRQTVPRTEGSNRMCKTINLHGLNYSASAPPSIKPKDNGFGCLRVGMQGRHQFYLYFQNQNIRGLLQFWLRIQYSLLYTTNPRLNRRLCFSIFLPTSLCENCESV